MAGLAWQGAARAGTVRICNETGAPIFVALGYAESGDVFATRGWWTAAAGQCTAHIQRGSDGQYFLHVKSARAPIAIRSSGPPMSMCVSSASFKEYANANSAQSNELYSDCASRALHDRDFVAIRTHANSQDSFALQDDGTLRPSSAQTGDPNLPTPPDLPPKEATPSASTPQAQAPRVPSRSETTIKEIAPKKAAAEEPRPRKAAPSAPPPGKATPEEPPNASRTPNACKRYPSLC